MIIGCWNIAWKRPTHRPGKTMMEMLLAHGPELLCIAEGHTNSLRGGWHGIWSAADYGYIPKAPTQRKIALWSRNPWENVDSFGSADLPPGRYVSGVTSTSLGKVRVVGICIPWFAAHSGSGRNDRQPWQDHITFLQGLGPILAALPTDLPVLLLGDFNQRIPKGSRTRQDAHDLLLSVLGERFSVWTAGSISPLEKRPVCHICGTEELTCDSILGLSRMNGAREMSDHDGLVATIGLASI